MDHRARIVNQISGRPVDRIPMIGGWNMGVRTIAGVAGIPVEDYLKDPFQGVMAANRVLGVDGMVPPVIPTELDQIRTGSLQEHTFHFEPEALRDRAAAIPDDRARILAKFDAAAEELRIREHLGKFRVELKEIELLPTWWDAPAHFSLYGQYGYQAFLSAIALYPEAVERIYWEDGIIGRERNQVLARMFRELDLPPLLLTGHDICNNSGPMCSPEFLRKCYWPHAAYALQPLVEAGIRLIAHCDGNVMPLVDDMLQAGFSGFQGFQYECGVDPYALAKRRSLKGEKPLFMAGLSVSRTLPFGTEQDVRDEVDYCLDYTDGGRGLFLFTSNVTGAETPPRNLVAAYRHLAGYVPGTRPRRVRQRRWPWRVSHPD